MTEVSKHLPINWLAVVARAAERVRAGKPLVGQGLPAGREVVTRLHGAERAATLENLRTVLCQDPESLITVAVALARESQLGEAEILHLLMGLERAFDERCFDQKGYWQELFKSTTSNLSAGEKKEILLKVTAHLPLIPRAEAAFIVLNNFPIAERVAICEEVTNRISTASRARICGQTQGISQLVGVSVSITLFLFAGLPQAKRSSLYTRALCYSDDEMTTYLAVASHGLKESDLISFLSSNSDDFPAYRLGQLFFAAFSYLPDEEQADLWGQCLDSSLFRARVSGLTRELLAGACSKVKSPAQFALVFKILCNDNRPETVGRSMSVIIDQFADDPLKAVPYLLAATEGWGDQREEILAAALSSARVLGETRMAHTKNQLAERLLTELLFTRPEPN